MGFRQNARDGSRAPMCTVELGSCSAVWCRPCSASSFGLLRLLGSLRIWQPCHESYTSAANLHMGSLPAHTIVIHCVSNIICCFQC